jgi:hypothetical protein
MRGPTRCQHASKNTCTLIARAQQDETLPIPVVFNLSTWAAFVEQHKQQATLADWLVAELDQRYSVRKKTAQEWVERNQVLPLLDGLDEVQQQHRASCVEAINAYRKQEGLAFNGLVVCSRISNYEAIKSQLRLRKAVTLQPLTEKQRDIYLEQAGTFIKETSKKVLRKLEEISRKDDDTEALKLAYSPLLLSIIAMACEEVTIEQLHQLQSSDAVLRHIFDAYTRKMLTLPNEYRIYHLQLQTSHLSQKSPYTFEQTTRWLSWLATRMVEHGQTVFSLEQMQPTWIQSRGARWLYRSIAVLIFGLIGGLFVGLFFGLFFGLLGGLIFGLIFGLFVGLFGGLSS